MLLWVLMADMTRPAGQVARRAQGPGFGIDAVVELVRGRREHARLSTDVLAARLPTRTKHGDMALGRANAREVSIPRSRE